MTASDASSAAVTGERRPSRGRRRLARSIAWIVAAARAAMAASVRPSRARPQCAAGSDNGRQNVSPPSPWQVAEPVYHSPRCRGRSADSRPIRNALHPSGHARGREPAETARMSGPVVLESLDLAALLCSRVCHDLISPVGAIVNGLEVLEDDNDESTKTFALELIKKSARTASARLQFCRLAFGAAGSAGRPDRPRRRREGRARLPRGRQDQARPGTCRACCCPKNRVKLLLNLLLLAGQTIPRGGTLTVDPIGRGGRDGLPGDGVRPQCADSPGGAGLARRASPTARRSMPTRSSRSTPACWRAPAGLSVALAGEGDGVVVTARPADGRLIGDPGGRTAETA